MGVAVFSGHDDSFVLVLPTLLQPLVVHQEPGIGRDPTAPVQAQPSARHDQVDIAQGHQRRTTVEYLRFLDIASGSRAELETQLLLCQNLGYLNDQDPDALVSACEDVAKLLASLSRALRNKLEAPNP